MNQRLNWNKFTLWTLNSSSSSSSHCWSCCCSRTDIKNKEIFFFFLNSPSSPSVTFSSFSAKHTYTCPPLPPPSFSFSVTSSFSSLPRCKECMRQHVLFCPCLYSGFRTGNHSSRPPVSLGLKTVLPVLTLLPVLLIHGSFHPGGSEPEGICWLWSIFIF